ncbi:hypothetical protein TNIN_280421 [Trichonephila inaurata madagascariensis]|uniref:Uncharacterized protein n=1 Tax=Trichonephila inaurata madagascariensis TaxID=2747483 RepID=A0A8X6MJK4_9ARAC|nr:hypothetical protein TNIN_280421 [Trichonephila inaurata madagascariensis]
MNRMKQKQIIYPPSNAVLQRFNLRHSREGKLFCRYTRRIFQRKQDAIQHTHIAKINRAVRTYLGNNPATHIPRGSLRRYPRPQKQKSSRKGQCQKHSPQIATTTSLKSSTDVSPTTTSRKHGNMELSQSSPTPEKMIN